MWDLGYTSKDADLMVTFYLSIPLCGIVRIIWLYSPDGTNYDFLFPYVGFLPQLNDIQMLSVILSFYSLMWDSKECLQ